MCLETIRKQPFIAEKDIPVYKVLNKNLFAPYVFNFKYELDKLYKSEEATPIYKDKGKSLYYISKNAFHAYTSYGTAKQFCMKQYQNIYNVIIPKGSIYWIGYSFCDICSDRIIVLSKEIPWYKKMFYMFF